MASANTQNVLDIADDLFLFSSSVGEGVSVATQLAEQSCPAWLSTGAVYLFIARTCVKTAKATTKWVVDSCKTPGLPGGDYSVASFDLTISRYDYINGATNDWETSECHQVIIIFTSRDGSRYYHYSYYEVICPGRSD